MRNAGPAAAITWRALGVALLAGGSALAAQGATTLTVCTDESPEGFDIVQAELAATNDAAGMTLYDQLLRFKPGSAELQPALAEAWEISADGLAYTLKLRPGVRFHSTPWFTPSREMNADDVLFSIGRMADKAHPAHASARSGYIYWAGMKMSELVQRVDKLDAMTVRFTLSRPDAAFLASLAMSAIGSVYPAEYAQSLIAKGRLDRLNTQPVGSGPFVFQSYQKDAVVRYAAHPGYWAGRPAIDRLVFAITPDQSVRAQRVMAGECLIGTYMKPSSVPALEAHPKLRVSRDRPLATSYLALNTGRGRLADVRLRRALSLAIDKSNYVRIVSSGLAAPASSFLPASMWSHDKTLADRVDVEEARALVRASGYDGTQLTLFCVGDADRMRAASLLQADWARIGVKVGVRALEIGELFKRAGLGEHDIVLMSWYSDNGDPDNFFTPNLSCSAVGAGSNKARWCDARFDEWLAAALRTTDTVRRSELYRQAQRRLVELVPVIPLTYPMVATALDRRVEGFVASPFSHLDFRTVRVRP